MKSSQQKIVKQINTIRKSIRHSKQEVNWATGFQSDRNRIHNEIRDRYRDLFALIQLIRRATILGVQNVDILVQLDGEGDFNDCLQRYNALNPLMIKYFDVFDEIICLIENGFPDGAMQRWRTLLEYTVIALFILEQGEEVAKAYIDNFINSVHDELHPRTNYAWALAAACLKDEKQISFTKLLYQVRSIDINLKNYYRVKYKLTSQIIHGSVFGINLSFNDHISFNINDLNEKNADYYTGGVSTVITHTMPLFYLTFLTYFNTFPDGGVEMKELLQGLIDEYAKVVGKS
ncbi:DUF5677 domain-containing protein [Bacillus sp. B-jedd]|uniref:DUF5677 domain-containing protein n=1 Tax=Bacillus sp. B-jedd TaxID=1476857 RepID=UPI0005156266|nr:DUF5677 domain-containing protein [Bacillus sp. B-jedd]CEG28734.1 hypothetical protein BN1002_03657 [Bacillus sp. B-jedd]